MRATAATSVVEQLSADVPVFGNFLVDVIYSAHESLLASCKVVVANFTIHEVGQTINWTYLLGLRNCFKSADFFFSNILDKIIIVQLSSDK